MQTLANQIAGMVAAVEGVKLVAVTGTPVALTDDPSVGFTRLWLYPGKAVVGGLITPNAGSVQVGKGGSGGTFFPDILETTDVPMLIQSADGKPMQLSQVAIKGTAGDGVFYSAQ